MPRPLKGKKSSLQIIGSILLTVVVLLALLVLTCGTLWEYVLRPVLGSVFLSADWGEGYDVPTKKVPVDLSALPAEPTERDFVLIATQLLEHESNRAGFYPVFVSWEIPCGSNVYAPSEVFVSASWYSATSPPRYQLFGDVSLWPQRNEAQITIADSGTLSFEYTVPGLDLDGLRYHVDEALRLAEKQVGQEYRQTIRDQCDIVLRLSSTKPTWLVEYGNHLCVNVNHQTGDVYTTTMTSEGKCGW